MIEIKGKFNTALCYTPTLEAAAAEQIRLGLVSLNYAVCDKADAPVREGDVISLRGKGKGQVREIGGRSKKDRLFITAERRL